MTERGRFHRPAEHPDGCHPGAAYEPLIFRAADIASEVQRLLRLPDHSERDTWLVHPAAPSHALGLAPGIGVTLSVLAPGETSLPRRSNATEVHFVVAGAATTRVGSTTHVLTQHDVINVPSHRWISTTNSGNAPYVALLYSNRPLLQLLGVYLSDTNHTTGAAEPIANATTSLPSGVAPPVPPGPTSSPFGNMPVDATLEGKLRAEGPWLMPYELLIHPPVVVSPSLHWPWDRVRNELDALMALGATYVGRRLYLLYNPRTGGTNGTTPSFFATITMRPPGIVDRPHRHASAAINYFFQGHGRSVVGGRTYEWEAGDLMLTAPAWMIHHHASDPTTDPVYELTVQDQPLHLAMESLLWQEDLRTSPVLLGIEAGFETNREPAS